MTSLSKHAMQPNSVRLCQGCELPVDIVDLPNGKKCTLPTLWHAIISRRQP